MKRRKGCLITLLVFAGLFVIVTCLALKSWRDVCGLTIARVNDTTIIADINDSVYALTDLKGKYQNDTLIIHPYSKFLFFTILKSRRKSRRALILERSVKYVKYRDRVYSYGQLPLYPDYSESYRKAGTVVREASRIVKE